MASNQKRLRTIIITAPERLDQEWITRLMHADELDVVERVGVTSLGTELARQHRPDLVIIDREIAHAESAIRQILAVSPYTVCVALVPALDVPVLRRLMAAGARDVLAAPVVYNDLLRSIRTIAEAEAERRRSVQATGFDTHQRGKLIVITAPKGGVGTTTIATNLAVALRQVSGREVALADFSLQFGDVGVHLNLRSKYSICDLTGRGEDIDDAALKRVLNLHDSGIQVLLAPTEPDMAAHISGAEVDQILDLLLDQYAYVVADTWSFLDEVAETLLRRADEVLLVTTPELPTLKNAKRFLEYTTRQELGNGRCTIVLNRFPSVEGISLQDVQQHLHHPVSANVPSEGQLVTHSINRGIPLVVSHPQSWTAQSLLKLAGKLVGDQVNTITLSADEARRSSDQQLAGAPLGLRRFFRKAS